MATTALNVISINADHQLCCVRHPVTLKEWWIDNNMKALPGDHLLMDKDGHLTEHQHSKNLVAGKLIVNTKKRYGKNGKGLPWRLMIPLKRSYPPFLVASSYSGEKDTYVVVQPLRWSKAELCPRGSIVHLLQPDDWEMALLHKHQLYFPRHKALTDPITEPTDNDSVTTFPHVLVVDPADSRDFDDGFTVEGDQLVHIHIADVSYYLDQLPAVDREAQKRCTSVYPKSLPVRHMLPNKLATDVISLNTNGPKRVLTVTIDLQTAELVSIKRNVVSVTHQVSYEDSVDLAPMKQLMAFFKIDDPHEVVERLMVLCNHTIAVFLKSSGYPLLRVQAPPLVESPETLEFMKQAPATYISSFDKGDNTDHYGLGCSAYTHFTSPMRRYFDVCVHRLVLALLNNAASSNILPPLTLLEQMNAVNRNVKRFERDVDMYLAYDEIDEAGPDGVTTLAMYLGPLQSGFLGQFYIPEKNLFVCTSFTAGCVVGSTYRVCLYAGKNKKIHLKLVDQ